MVVGFDGVEEIIILERSENSYSEVIGDWKKYFGKTSLSLIENSNNFESNKCKQTWKSEAFYENFFGFELESLKKSKYRQSWAVFLIFFFDTKTSEAKPSEFAIRSHETKPSVMEHA